MHEQDNSYYRDPEFLEVLSKWEDIEHQGMRGYMDSDDLADVAEYYYTSHQRARGDRCIDFGLKLHPKATCLLIFKARSLMMQHHYDEATRLLDAADDQQNREVVYLRAELLILDGNRKAADALLQRNIPDEAEVDDEEDEEADLVNSYHREVVGLWLDYDDLGRAAQWADRLRALPDLSNRDRIMLADYASAAGQSHVAHSILRGIVEDDPYNVSAWNLLAEVCLDEENYQEATDACETVLAIEEDNYQATITLIHTAYAQGNALEVIRLAREGSEKWPEDDICPLYEGMARVHQYTQCETPDILLLTAAYLCLQDAKQNAKGQSAEQANIIMFLAYVMGEYYYNATDEKQRDEYRRQAIEYMRQCKSYGRECSQLAFQLGNMLIEMGELQLAEEFLGSSISKQ